MDNVDDAQQFKYTQVSHVYNTANSMLHNSIYSHQEELYDLLVIITVYICLQNWDFACILCMCVTYNNCMCDCVQEAMSTLGFTDDEQLSMFKTISGILHFGNIEVKQRPREEWATIPNTTGRTSHTHTHTHAGLTIMFSMFC